jgi:hypothetical protein
MLMLTSMEKEQMGVLVPRIKTVLVELVLSVTVIEMIRRWFSPGTLVSSLIKMTFNNSCSILYNYN